MVIGAINGMNTICATRLYLTSLQGSPVEGSEAEAWPQTGMIRKKSIEDVSDYTLPVKGENAIRQIISKLGDAACPIGGGDRQHGRKIVSQSYHGQVPLHMIYIIKGFGYV